MAFSTILTGVTFSTTSMLGRLHVCSNRARPPPPSLLSARSFRIAASTAAHSKDENPSKRAVLRVYTRQKAWLTLVIPELGEPWEDEPWDVVEDEEAMYARCYVPGLDKAGLKISVENNKVFIKGNEAERDPKFKFKYYNDYEKPRKYEGSIEFLGDLVMMDEMKADIKHGVLMIVVPKLRA